MAYAECLTESHTNGQFVYIHQSIGLILRITCHCRCSNVQGLQWKLWKITSHNGIHKSMWLNGWCHVVKYLWQSILIKYTCEHENYLRYITCRASFFSFIWLLLIISFCHLSCSFTPAKICKYTSSRSNTLSGLTDAHFTFLCHLQQWLEKGSSSEREKYL